MSMIRFDPAPDLRRALERLAPGSAKVFGSALLQTGGADLDIAVAERDDATFAYLLNIAPAHGIHPVRFPQWLFDDLHNRLSWKNMCVTADARTGEVVLGREHVSGRELVFNPPSRDAFPDLRKAVRSARKLSERHGFSPPGPSERLRAQLHLHGNVASLADLAREALTDQVVHILAAFGAVVAGGFFRDEVDGRTPKDIDVFVPAGRDWEQLCNDLSEILEEVEFEKPEGKRVNLRKFRAKSACPGHEMLVVDVIDYGFVHSTAHVVETFDFVQNMLWWDPSCHLGIQGGQDHSVEEIFHCIRERILKVGDNLWYRAGVYRALSRWQRFRRDGYIPDAQTVEKYSNYVKMMMDEEKYAKPSQPSE